MNIPALKVDVPNCGAYTFEEIRNYLLDPRYLNGPKIRQRIPVEYVLYNEATGEIVSKVDELRPFWFKSNGVTLDSSCPTYTLMLVDKTDRTVFHAIPAALGYFITEIYK